MNIKVDLNTDIADGSEVVFRSPADCSQVTGLVIYHKHGKTEFAFADAHGNNVGDIDHLFAENAVVKVILDVASSMAFVQNADTNAYIERTFVKSVNGQAPDKKGNVEVEIEIPESIPAGGDPNMEVSFDVAHAQMMTAPEFVIADPENPFGSIILTKEGASEDEDEPKNIAVLQKATGEPVILRGIETPTDPLDAVNLRKLVEYYHLLKQYADGKSVNVSHGKLGQHLAVAAVNQDGEIAGWKVEDPPTFGFRHIRTVTIPEDITTDTSGVKFAEQTNGGVIFALDTDENGEPFTITELFVFSYAGSAHSSKSPVFVGPVNSPVYGNSGMNWLIGFSATASAGANGVKTRGVGVCLGVPRNYMSFAIDQGASTNAAVKGGWWDTGSFPRKITAINICTTNGYGFTAGSEFVILGR